MKYRWGLALGILAVLIALFFIWNTQKDSLNGLGFWFSGIDSFSIEERFSPYFDDYEEVRISAHSHLGSLQLAIISNITKQHAEKYTSSQTLLFEGMFDKELPPYPEFLTNATGCTDEFLPQKNERSLGNYYTTYAGDRFNYGICDQGTARYRVGVGIFYCEEDQRLIKISYYIDKSDDFDKIGELMDSFACLNE